MNKHLSELITISNFDKQIDDLLPQIALVRKELDEKIRQKEQLLKQVSALESEIATIELDVANHDKNIKECAAKLDGITKKQKEVKSEKEMRALDVESDIAKENMTHSNSEIERLEAIKKGKNDEKEALNPQIEALEALIKELDTKTQGEVNTIKAKQQELFKQKESLIDSMDSKITGFYAKIRRWAGNSSVVSVYKQACGGCFIKLNESIYNEILKGQDIINCPHCGRILYNSATNATSTAKKRKKKAEA